MDSEFVSLIEKNQRAFQLTFDRNVLERIAAYYALVQEHNPLLHLVGPCTPEEFAVRHILESVLLLEHLPQNARFADVGAGAGLPSIPCLLARDDLSAVLIESKLKKAAFLSTAIDALGLGGRAKVIDTQFEEVKEKDFAVVTCRALDKFVDKLPRILKWSGRRKKVLFGGPSLRVALAAQRVRFTVKLIPMSEQRYLFVLD
jgi:16S rRNA (guanine527-N7)-methyltransferase